MRFQTEEHVLRVKGEIPSINNLATTNALTAVENEIRNVSNLVKQNVPAVVKNINVKVFNLMSRTNETRHIEWHETCKCKCRLDGSI